MNPRFPTSLTYRAANTTRDNRGASVTYGHIVTPQASSRAAYGNILTPMVHAKGNANGRVLLVLAGAHGDEAEGIIALNRIIQNMHPADMDAGEIIIIPCANIPAMLNNSRTSPLDDQDMNRVYPGHSKGTPTERMADFILNHIIPVFGVTHVIDIHSGGKTLNMLPHVAYHTHDENWTYNQSIDPVDRRRDLANMLTTFKNIVVAQEPDMMGTLDFHVESQDIPFCYIESQGAGHSPRTHQVKQIEHGIRNVGVKLGIFNKGIAFHGPHVGKPTDMYIAHGSQMSHHGGLLELLVTVGDEVNKTDSLARIYHPHHPDLQTTMIYAETSGTIIALSNQTLIEPGDTLCTIASKHPNKG
uniref:N-alpha-acetyl-L-2,4-diaminobutyric acid deacetylase n=1 Tax=Pseudomonas phage Cygsa01 TaxID=3138529 RepID=A0AAU6W3N2_9VIRU